MFLSLTMSPFMSSSSSFLFLLTIGLISRFFVMVNTQPNDHNHLLLQPTRGGYTREQLLGLRQRTPPYPKPTDYEDFPRDIRPRKWGKKGGIRKRVRKRGFRPPLPTIVMGNVRSLQNKMDELRANVRYLHEYRESCLLIFTETWLHSGITDSAINLDNFSIVRGDRTEASGKSRGGGVCMYIDNQWCNNWSVKDTKCTPDYELLIVGLRPFYLPRELKQIFVLVVYIPPRADVGIASDFIATKLNDLEALSPDSAKIITGDFNQCRLDTALPTYKQYVQQPTRNETTLDLCYCNIPQAYASKACPPACQV